tara:strand:- start:58 stop:225 length:168 start_codon:yes stop_codon:yes gene_type:complete
LTLLERLEQAQLGSVVGVHAHAEGQQLRGRDLADLVRVRARVGARARVRVGLGSG